MVLYMFVIQVATEFRYSDFNYYLLCYYYMYVYFVPLGSNFDYTLNVKVITVHALIVPCQSLYADNIPDGGRAVPIMLMDYAMLHCSRNVTILCSRICRLCSTIF